VTAGGPLQVTATILNTGDQSGTQTVDLSVGGLGSDSTSVSLNGGSSTQETFSVSTAGGDAGDYTAQVSSVDDSASQSVTVTAAPDSSVNAQNGLAYNDGFGYAESDGKIVKFDVESGEIVNSFDSPSNWARGLAYGAGSLWFADGVKSQYDGEILELNPDTGAVRSRISTSYDPMGLAFGGGSLWVIDITANDIIEYSTEGDVQSSFDTPGTTWGNGLAYFNGSLWLGTYDTNALHKFSADGTRETIIGERETGYGGLATTDTELLGPGPDGNVTVLRTLRNGRTSGPPPLPGYQNPPQDMDGNGLYEAVTGTGSQAGNAPSIADVVALFQNLGSPEVQNYAEYYKFNEPSIENPTRVGIADVVALFRQI
jgi:hypothetical protein